MIVGIHHGVQSFDAKTCLNDSRTAFGLWSHIHLIALHMLSAMVSELEGDFSCVQIFYDILAVLVQYL